MIRPSFAALLAAFLTACAAHDPQVPSASDGRRMTPEAVAVGGAGRSPGRAATPVVELPAWIGRPLRLEERDDPAAFEQIVGFGPNRRDRTQQNVVRLAAIRSGAAQSEVLDSPSSIPGPPTEGGIRAELAMAFPDLTMHVVTAPPANAYGVYGLAVGRGAGRRNCLYAWQWIADGHVIDGGTTTPVSLRVRLCRDDIGLDAMVAAVSAVRLVPRFEGRPLAKPGRPAGPPGRPASRRFTARPIGNTTVPDPIRGQVDAPAERPRVGPRYLGDATGTDLAVTPGAGGSRRASDPSAIAANRSKVDFAADLPSEAFRGPVARP